MKYLAEIHIMPHKELLDPQGKAVKNRLPNIGVNGVQDVRVGKRVELTVEAPSENEAKEMVQKACKSMLANPIMEKFEFTISSVA